MTQLLIFFRAACGSTLGFLTCRHRTLTIFSFLIRGDCLMEYVMELRCNFTILTLFFFGITHCQLEDMQEAFETNKKYCGSHLAQALSTICRGRYNTLHKKGQYQKRAHWDTLYSADLSYSDTVSFPFQKRSEANSLVGNYRRRKRFVPGVYNECCEKSCSREELSSYCASADSSRTRR